jgi:hypothetical protein
METGLSVSGLHVTQSQVGWSWRILGEGKAVDAEMPRRRCLQAIGVSGDGQQDELGGDMSRPGFVGDSQPCEGRSHASSEEVSG